MMDRRLYLICELEDGKKTAIDIHSIVTIDELGNGLCKLFIEKSAFGLEATVRVDFDTLIDNITTAIHG